MKLTDKKTNAVREYLCIPDDVITCTDIIEATYKALDFACWDFNRCFNELTKAISNLARPTKKASKSVSEFNKLISDIGAASDERVEIIQKINEKYPEIDV